jgi:hypothetical protein
LRGWRVSSSSSPFFESGLHDFGRPTWSLRFCQFISVSGTATSSPIMDFDFRLIYLYSFIFLSLLSEDIPHQSPVGRRSDFRRWFACGCRWARNLLGRPCIAFCQPVSV